MIKNTYRKLLLILLTFCSVNAFAQTEEEAVKAVINQLFEGMKKGDSALIRLAFSPSATLETVVKNREGLVRIRRESIDSFLVSIARPHTDVYDERITFEMVKIDDELALAWTPYKFYIGDKFSHCGVNSFQLVKVGGKWAIQYLIDTRRRQNCE